MYVWIFTEGWMRSQSRPHLPQITDKQSWRGLALEIQPPTNLPQRGIVDTNRAILDNDNSTTRG